MKDTVELFVPGRICLFGEHSDWAGGYRRINSAVGKGYCLIAGTNQGLYARVQPHDSRFIYKAINAAGKQEVLDIPMTAEELLPIAQAGGFWSYAAGVAYQILTHYSVRGLIIDNYRTDLPLRKGLSSSAAVCVLTTRAFNRVYDLKMTTRGEMDLAYRGEITTPSRCGRMDQGCAYGSKPILLTIDGDSLDVEELSVGADLHYVLVDLKAKKDTVKILAALNKAYPFAETPEQLAVQDLFGGFNQGIIRASIEAIKQGDAQKLGELMKTAQSEFDAKAAPLCPDELRSPQLHALLAETRLQPHIWGGKGVGSQGDGTAQFIARSAESQNALVKTLQEMGYDPLPLVLHKTQKVKKALVTAAGFGTRLFPMTKVIRKEFLPVVDKGVVKPLIATHVEALIDAGIEEVWLLIQPEEEAFFRSYFQEALSPEHYAKLGPEARMLADRISENGRRIKYLYQKEQKGLGHAVLQAAELVGDEPMLIVLGDHWFRAEAGVSCVQQILDAYEASDANLVGLALTPEAEIGRFGCVGGTFENDETGLFAISVFSEKPGIEYAREHLRVKGLKEGTYLTVFGLYLADKDLFTVLRRMEEEGRYERGELQLTSALEEVRRISGYRGCLIRGTKTDIGVPSVWQSIGRN